MQDNKNMNDSEFSGEFLDRAWGHMSNMLDQEMPVVEQVSKEADWKRYLLLFLSLGLGVFIGASLVLFWPTPEEGTGPSVEQEQERVYAESGAAGSSSSDNNSGEQPPDLINLPRASQAPSQWVSATDLASNNHTITNNQSTAYTIKSTFLSPENTNQVPSTQERSFIPINRSPLDVSPQLYLEQPGQLATSSYQLPPTNLVEPQPRFKKDEPSLGLSVGMLTENYEEVDGFEAGVRAEIPLNERFSLQTGAYYRTLTKNKRADYAGSLDEPGAPNVSQVETSSFPVYSMAYIAVPASLNYKLTKKVKVSAGVDVAYLTRARIGDNPIGFLGNDPDQMIANDLPAYLENGMRRWDISASVGVSYQPTDRIILDARYNQGMMDFTKNNVYGIQALNNHRFLKVGLNYIFTNRS